MGKFIGQTACRDGTRRFSMKERKKQDFACDFNSIPLLRAHRLQSKLVLRKAWVLFQSSGSVIWYNVTGSCSNFKTNVPFTLTNNERGVTPVIPHQAERAYLKPHQISEAIFSLLHKQNKYTYIVPASEFYYGNHCVHFRPHLTCNAGFRCGRIF